MLDRSAQEARQGEAADKPRPVAFRGGGFTPGAGRYSGWIALAIVIALWQLAGSAGWINPLFLPPPSAIAVAITKMAAKKMSAAEIAAILELDVEMVRQAMAHANGK